MGYPFIPDNEGERLAKLRSLHILDTYEENGTFKHIAAIASCMFNIPIALVNFVDKDYVITKCPCGDGRLKRGEQGCEPVFSCCAKD